MKTFADYGIQVSGSGNVKTLCPQCSAGRKNKKDPCLSVNISEGIWYCHHCDWKGCIKEDRWESAPHHILSFFVDRHISLDTVKECGVTVGQAWMPQHDGKVSAIQFRYLRGADVVNIKFRGPQKSFRMMKGGEQALYGLNDIGAETIIVEGEMDKLALWEAGFKNVVSVPNGAPSADAKDLSGKFVWMDLDKAKIDKVESWIIAVDNDGPGARLEAELARRFGWDACKRVRWPEGCKDANDVLMRDGRDVLRECVKSAEAFPIEGAFSMISLKRDIVRLYEKGWDRGVSTGWGNLDEFYTVRPGEMTVLTGVPNSGKSNFLDAMMVNLARNENWSFGLFSPENQPLEDHASRLIEKMCGRAFSGFEAITQEEVESGITWGNDHFTWILPPDDDWTLGNVLGVARSLVRTKGITGLVLDPWNELEASRPSHITETEFISDSLKKIRQFARRHSVHVWIVAHPAKMYRDKDGQYPVPTMYDIAGSAHWRNKADNGLCIWRDFNAPGTPIEVHIQKIRFRQVGKVGMTEFKYRASTCNYSPAQAVAQL